MNLQDQINDADANVQVSRETMQDLRNKIVRLALEDRCVRAAAAELRQEQERFDVLLKYRNDLIRQQLKETFG